MKNQWISFDEIINQYGYAEFEIVQLFKDGLTPYHTETGEALPYPYNKATPTKWLILGQPWHMILMNWKAWGNDYLVRAFRSGSVIWKKADIEALGPKDTGSESKHIEIKTPAGTQWKDIQFKYVNESYIQIECPMFEKSYVSKTDLGLDGKPVLMGLFRIFAQRQGRIKLEDKSVIKENISRLREHLKNVFPGVDGDPIQSISGQYACAFKIECSNTEPLDENDGETIQRDFSDNQNHEAMYNRAPHKAAKSAYKKTE